MVDSDSSNTMRPLGKTDILVSPVAMGCWPIAGMTSLNVNDQDSIATLQAAADNGINFFDTAYGYGASGESDRLIARAFAGRGNDIVIASKAGMHWLSETERVFDASPARIISQCEESLGRLNVDCIDLFYLHAPDPDTPIADSASAFARLLEQGKVRSVGVSNCSIEQMESFLSVCPITAVQLPMNMLQQDIQEEVVPWCQRRSISVINYWPLMKGLLAGAIRRGHEFDPNDKRLTYEVFQGSAFERAQQLLDLLDVIAAEKGSTVSQVVVNWTVHQPGITSTLCGAKRAWQIEETAGAMRAGLTRSDLDAIDTCIARTSSLAPPEKE